MERRRRSLNLPKTEEEEALSLGLTYIKLDSDTGIHHWGTGNDMDYDYKLQIAHDMLDKQIRILEEIDANIKSFFSNANTSSSTERELKTQI